MFHYIALVTLAVAAFVPPAVEANAKGGADGFYIFEAYLTSGSCSNHIVSNWVEAFDVYYPVNSTTQGAGMFNNPTMIAPVAGYYHCCMGFRVQQRGYGDFTMNQNYNPVCGTGTRCTGSGNNCQWIHVSNCVNLQLNQFDQVNTQLQSTAGSDCIEETNWRYGQFNCFLYGAM